MRCNDAITPLQQREISRRTLKGGSISRVEAPRSRSLSIAPGPLGTPPADRRRVPGGSSLADPSAEWTVRGTAAPAIDV
jgi:hypothetical protein